ncbi:S8 family peptidase [Haloferacaceae archaeon DSL9]
MQKDNSRQVHRRNFLKLTGAAGLFAGFSGVTSATPGRRPGPKKDEILVGVTSSEQGPKATIESRLPAQARIVHENEQLSYVAVEFPSTAPAHARENFVRAITKRDEVKYAEPNMTLSAFATPDDPSYGDQYAPQMVNAPTAWDSTYGDRDVTVAIVDTGVQYDHEDLAGVFASDPGEDFVTGDGDPAPVDEQNEFHGTHVAGIAGAETDNGTGVAGISNSTLISARALDENGSGSTADIADAITWAADEGADVINLSLGGPQGSSTLESAVSYAHNRGSLVVAAAGNDGQQAVSYPAAYSECVAVSALDPDESLASYSNYGSEIDLAAPGSNVLSTTTTARGSYERLSGTSMASPVVAGVAGLTLAQWNLTNEELRTHLFATAVDIGLSETQQGSGRVDAGNAVATEPGSGGGDGGDDGSGESVSASVDGSLSYSGDSECWQYGWTFDNPSRVVIELSGPTYSDFDLYVNEGRGYCPTTSDYDHRAITPDSQEVVAIDDPDTSANLFPMAYSYSGWGDYTLTITEYE